MASREAYPSVEHAYQAAKTIDKAWRRKIQRAATPKVAKSLGQVVPIVADWEDIKVDVMHDLVRDKFRSHPGLAHKLIATGDEELIEGNWWGDTFWGVCRGKGQNHLGKILMAVRAELKEDMRD